MKVCASTYSFGKYRREGVGFMIDKAAELGFDGIEIVSGNFEGWDDPKVAEEVKKKCAEKGLAVASLCTGAELLHGDRSAEVARLSRVAEIAAAYGAPLMRHDISSGPDGENTDKSYMDAIPVFAPACREVAQFARSVGVVSTTENHGYFSQDSSRVAKLIEAVGHENFGALVDIGNFMCADEDPNAAVAVLAKYARHVHAKDFYLKPGGGTDPGEGWFGTRGGNLLKGTIVGHGDARAAESLCILQRAGYDGWISVEFEGMEDNLAGLRIGLANVRRFWELF